MKFIRQGLMVLSSLAAGSLVPAAIAEEASSHQSGYGDVSDLGGPESVSNQIRDADEIRPAWFEIEDAIAGYFDWKQQLYERRGFATSTSLLTLYQHADQAVSGNEHGSGLIFRWQGSWDLVGRESGRRGGLRWRLENRSNLSDQSPSELGAAMGAAALNPGFGYAGNFDWDLSVLNWTQGFADNRAAVVVGRLDFAAYLDAFAFQTFSRGFLNRAFLVNPTIGTTGVGALGAVAKGMVTDQIWLGGGIYDANASNGEFDWDTVGEGEYLRHIEIGWTPSFARRAKDRAQFTWWEKDERKSAGTTKGSGWAISASWQARDALLIFLRAGHSDGGAGVAAESAVSVGMEARLPDGNVLSLGAGWAQPNRNSFGRGVGDEWVVEASYKIQLTRTVTLLPNLQLLFDPAADPSADTAVVLGIRAGIAI